MKVSINTEHCLNGIQKASNLTPPRTGAASLRAMWIKTDKEAGTICFMATDASTEYVGTYQAEVEEDGFIGVQSKSLTDLIRSLPPGVIRMETDEQNLIIRQGNRRYKLPTCPSDWFQSFSPSPEGESIAWSGEILIDIIEKTIFCISDEEQSALGCLFINPKENGEIDFCGLDGNKFAIYKIINDQLIEKLPKEGILIQKKHLSDLRKLISNNDIEINFDTKRIFFSDNGGKDIISIPLVQYSYPEYMPIVNKIANDDPVIIKINKTELVNALSRNMIFNTKEEYCVYITINDDSITLNSKEQKTGSATETINAYISKKTNDVAFVTKSLIEVIQHMTSEKLVIKICSSEGPCMFQDEDNLNYLVIAMPMKIVNDTYYEEENI